MSLRRPPTRIELKPDDIEEFAKVCHRFPLRIPSTSFFYTHDSFFFLKHYNRQQLKRDGKDMVLSPDPLAGDKESSSATAAGRKARKKAAATARIGLSQPGSIPDAS
jgi:hypothetical protein